MRRPVADLRSGVEVVLPEELLMLLLNGQEVTMTQVERQSMGSVVLLVLVDTKKLEKASYDEGFKFGDEQMRHLKMMLESVNAQLQANREKANG